MADGTVTASGLNLRKPIKPGDVVKVLRRSSRVEILGEEAWYRVKTRDGIEGYVFGDFVDIDAPSMPAVMITGMPTETCVLERYHHRRFIGKPVTADVEFFPLLNRIAKFGDRYGLSIHVTSSTRDPEGQINDAIVRPVTRSNHFIGHAIDINLLSDSGKFFNSGKLRKLDEQPLYLQRFIGTIRDDAELRWGGDFRTPDVVHIDDGFNKRYPHIYDAKLASRN